MTYSGVMRPSPKLVISLRCTWPEKPVTVAPPGPIAVMVVPSATPAYLCFWLMPANWKPESTSDWTLDEVPSGMVPSV